MGIMSLSYSSVLLLGILFPLRATQSFDPSTCTTRKLVVTDWSVIGDGVHDDTAAMRHLLSLPSGDDDCQTKHIVIPAHATVLTYPLNLTSHTILQVDGSLVAMASTHHWPIMPPVEIYGDSEDRYGGFTVNQYQAFLYAHNSSHIRITGQGVIDGNGPYWWDLFKRRDPALKPAGRPNLYQTVYCSHLEIDTVTMKDSPFWTVHPMLSSDIHIHHMKIRAPLYAPNVDGVDPDSAQNVMVEYNDIACGDDHIAIKAGVCGLKPAYYNECMDPAWSQRVKGYLTKNVTIRHNLFRTGMGIAIGSETSGTVRDVFIYNNTIGYCQSGDKTLTSCGWGPALHIKTTLTRSGSIDNIVFDRNIIYNTSMFIFLETNYQVGKQKLPSNYPKTVVQNIVFSNNLAVGQAMGAGFNCDKLDPCHNITVVNNTIVKAQQNNHNPWGCKFIESFNVHNNTPGGLEECMARSMNQTSHVDEYYAEDRLDKPGWLDSAASN
ncbi:Probable polygalacturonase [Seminavis robusta]|uniref:Probable polygalacturonase n=1 Tax=Seminavis robusta TaxID=568900 RepID=A0A9N8F2M3_9STRA|nr:Probable polygalacturonase [Seminavis robusta]|eukprot:Sro3945_g352070.1 Probable polygalacturonase (491) ;mRNA; r:2205-3677